MSEKMVSHYHIRESLGGGAMGQVFLAEDTLLRRKVALKFLPLELTEDEDALKRFMVEARATAKLDHANICNIHEIAQADNGAWFIAMAYYPGRTLKKELAAGPLPAARAIGYAQQIALGLSRAHNQGVVHRDIKPANIIITDHDEVKIVDFGLAMLSGGAHLTRTGTVMGTAAYMSPEQGRGTKADARSDIWSAGVVFYQMLSGNLPFPGEHDVAMIYSILNQDPEPLAGPDGKARQVCEKIIDRCLAKDPDKRYPDAAVLAEDLGVALSREMDSPKNGKSNPSIYIKPQRGRRAALGVLALAALVALALVIPDVRRTLAPFMPWVHQPRGVAVMPFALDGVEGAAALGEGLAWYITDRLNQIEGGSGRFWVAPHEDIAKASITSRDIAAKRLGVQYVATGKGTFDGADITLELNVFNPETRAYQTHEFVDSYGNLEMWQHKIVEWIALRVAPDLTAAQMDARAGPVTAIPSAFLADKMGQGHLIQAQTEPARGREHFNTAHAFFAEAVACDSSYTSAWAGLGWTTWNKYGDSPPDSLETAEFCLEKALQMDPLMSWATIYLSQLHLAQGDSARARDDARRAVKSRPENLSSWYNLARIYEGLELDVSDVYRDAVNSKPRYPRAHRMAGLHYYYLKDTKRTLAHWRKVAELTANDSAGYSLMGVALFEMERWDEAEEYFQRANTIEPHSTFSANLATIFFYQGRYRHAIDMYHRSLALLRAERSGATVEYDTYNMMAESFRWSPGEEDSARIYYTKALEALTPLLDGDPTDPSLLVDRSSFLINLDQMDEALGILATLESRTDLRADQMFTLATVYEETGQRDKALAWLERALEQGQSIKVVEVYPVLRNLRATSRYLEMKEKYSPE